jgi:hypothetical protein
MKGSSRVAGASWFSALHLSDQADRRREGLRRPCAVRARPASVRRLTLCSSRMRGNSHVRFFGGSVSARARGYPIPETRRCVRGPARGSRSVPASAPPSRACRRMIRTWRWSSQTTAPLSDAGSRRFQVTHPYHPLHLQEFELVLHAQNWHEDRVWFHDANGRLRALPASWTSVVGEDPFNVVAAGRALFRVEELLELGRLIATLEP